jgi:hypothetical protein
MPSYRVIKSGHIVEIYKYQATSILRRDDENFSSDKGGRDKEGIVSRKMEYSATVNQRARNKIRRLISANFTGKSLFVTLTYRENMTDFKESSYNLKKFFQKLKRKQKDFKYVAVVEFQKRGAIHYHMLCNLDFSWSSHAELQAHERALAALWGHGFIDIGYKANDNAGAYLIKYMTKDNNDERLNGQKRYFFSRNLDQPKELVGGEAIDIIKQYEGMPPVFTNEYYSDFHGKVQYLEYNPLRYDYNAYIDSLEALEDKCVNDAIELFGDMVEVKG